jgi:hypothetical protein
MMAAAKGDASTCSALIRAGAATQLRNKKGQQASDLATGKEVKLLFAAVARLQSVDRPEKSEELSVMLRDAVAMGYVSVVDLLLGARVQPTVTVTAGRIPSHASITAVAVGGSTIFVRCSADSFNQVDYPLGFHVGINHFFHALSLHLPAPHSLDRAALVYAFGAMMIAL